MDGSPSRRAVVYLVIVFTALALACFAIATVVENLAYIAAHIGGIFLALGYLATLVVVWMDGKPITMRDGKSLTKEQNILAYRFMLLAMSLAGVIPATVFISNLLCRQ